VGEQAFGVDAGVDEEHGARLSGFGGFRAEVEIEGAFDGFAVFGEVFGADGGFEWGNGFGGWIWY